MSNKVHKNILFISSLCKKIEENKNSSNRETLISILKNFASEICDVVNDELSKQKKIINKKICENEGDEIFQVNDMKIKEIILNEQLYFLWFFSGDCSINFSDNSYFLEDYLESVDAVQALHFVREINSMILKTSECIDDILRAEIITNIR